MKIKFNGMDVLIIIVLVAVIAAGGYFLMNRSQQQSAEKNTTVQMMVEFNAQEEGFIDLPKIGDEAVVGEKEKMTTKVTNVEVLPAKTLGYNTIDGWAKEVEVPERYDVQVTLEGEGVDTGDTVEMNGAAVRVGTKAAVKSKNWSGYGTVLVVDTID